MVTNETQSNSAAGMHYPDKGHDHEALTAIRKDYRWTPACQRMFLEELSISGSITGACAHVEKSPRSAYALRFRRDGAAFRLGWDAAILVARETLTDLLMDRATNGYEEISERGEDGIVTRRKYDNRLSMNLLHRLDRIAEAQAVRGSRGAHMQMAVQDWQAYLDLIERGGNGAQATLFFEAREPDPKETMAYALNHALHCELAQFSADSPPENMFDEEPEIAATRLFVWRDDDDGEWKTNFPPVEGNDAQYIDEEGIFGDEDYQRTLTPAEEEAHLTALIAARMPWIEAAAKARDAWFGRQEAA